MNDLEMTKAILDALLPRGSRILTLSDLQTKVLGAKPDEASGATRCAWPSSTSSGPASSSACAARSSRASSSPTSRPARSRSAAKAARGSSRASAACPISPIAPGALASALDGDVVLVRVEKPKTSSDRRPARGPRAPREQGVVVKVLVRRRETVVGKIARGKDGTFLVPFDRKIDAKLRVPDGKDKGAPNGIFVEARIVSWPDDRRLALAEVTDTIGFEGDPGVDVEVVARKWGLPRAYPEAVLKEAEDAAREVDAKERASRADFTGRTIVTIDGETARDFDDAIEAEELPGGGFRIGIHIADVSHYVPIGSALDAEAFERGTSVYFPDRALAMLPERLSNDLCSLRPDEERRTVSAVLTLDKNGEIQKSEFFRSLIKSRARLTYTQVGDFLEGEEGGRPSAPPPARREPTAKQAVSGGREGEGHSPSKKGVSSDVASMLRVAQKAAHILRSKRVSRGSLDFDLPDADVMLGETGDVVAITKAIRNEAHRLIEEFMLAANEAVAQHLQFVPTPALYRVHDRPDESRLVDLRAVLEPLGYELPEDEEEITPKVFQALLDEVAGKPEERFVTDLVLRSQKKALYSEECRGHYALAAKYYCHFTSPIRRYPDLLVHRALVEWLAIRRPPAAEDADGRTRWFHEAAAHCSSRERRAESAEREAVAWKKFVFLSSRVGEEFWAYVSAVVGFGLFVTLEDIYVDGLVPISSLEDDFYRYEDVEHRLVGSQFGRVYRLGDRLRVKLIAADSERRALDFKPVGDSAGPRRRSRVEALQRRPPRRPAPRGRPRRR